MNQTELSLIVRGLILLSQQLSDLSLTDPFLQDFRDQERRDIWALRDRFVSELNKMSSSAA